MVEVDRERGRIGLRLADDPDDRRQVRGGARRGGHRRQGPARRPRRRRAAGATAADGDRRAGATATAIAATASAERVRSAEAARDTQHDSTRASGSSPRRCPRCARSRSGSGSGPARATRPSSRRASRTSSSTCCSRAPTASARARSTRSSTRWARRSTRARARRRPPSTRASSTSHLERAFDVIQDMVLRPAYPDIDSERQVVIEEIAMYEDEPSDKVHDVLAERDLRRPPARPADHRPRRGDRLGARARHRRLPRRPLRARRTSWWRPPATSSTSASSSSSSDACRRETADGAARARPPNGVGAARCGFHQKETEQYHLCLGRTGHPARRRPPLRPARARHDPRRLDLVAAVPGGAREARPGLLRLLLLQPLRGLGPGRPSTWAPARTTSARRWR